MAVWNLLNEDPDTKPLINAYIAHCMKDYNHAEGSRKQPVCNKVV
jgi:hypothetical protein